MRLFVLILGCFVGRQIFSDLTGTLKGVDSVSMRLHFNWNQVLFEFILNEIFFVEDFSEVVFRVVIELSECERTMVRRLLKVIPWWSWSPCEKNLKSRFIFYILEDLKILAV